MLKKWQVFAFFTILISNGPVILGHVSQMGASVPFFWHTVKKSLCLIVFYYFTIPTVFSTFPSITLSGTYRIHCLIPANGTVFTVNSPSLHRPTSGPLPLGKSTYRPHTFRLLCDYILPCQQFFLSTLSMEAANI